MNDAERAFRNLRTLASSYAGYGESLARWLIGHPDSEPPDYMLPCRLLDCLSADDRQAIRQLRAVDTQDRVVACCDDPYGCPGMTVDRLAAYTRADVAR